MVNRASRRSPRCPHHLPVEAAGGGAIVTLPAAALLELEQDVELALQSGEHAHLELLGYGDISAVLACRAGGRVLACKRLPPFSSPAALDRYARTLRAYLDRLRAAGVQALETELQIVEAGGPAPVAYCVQPAFDPSSLLTEALGRADAGEARALFGPVVDAIAAAVSPRLGLDAGCANWALLGGQLVYIDTSTPLLRDAEGREEVDVELFLASVPSALRPLVRRFFVGPVLDRFYDLRSVYVDLMSWMLKEPVRRHVPALLEVVNARLRGRPITEAELSHYDRTNTALWTLLRRLRRVERFWQNEILGQTYPFLLPACALS